MWHLLKATTRLSVFSYNRITTVSAGWQNLDFPPLIKTWFQSAGWFSQEQHVTHAALLCPGLHSPLSQQNPGWLIADGKILISLSLSLVKSTTCLDLHLLGCFTSSSTMKQCCEWVGLSYARLIHARTWSHKEKAHAQASDPLQIPDSGLLLFYGWTDGVCKPGCSNAPAGAAKETTAG